MKMTEEQIFNAMSKDPKVYDAATPEEKAVYDSIVERRKKKEAATPTTNAAAGKAPDTVDVVVGAGAGTGKKEPTAAELISQSISSFSSSIVGALNSRGGL